MTQSLNVANRRVPLPRVFRNDLFESFVGHVPNNVSFIFNSIVALVVFSIDRFEANTREWRRCSREKRREEIGHRLKGIKVKADPSPPPPPPPPPHATYI